MKLFMTMHATRKTTDVKKADETVIGSLLAVVFFFGFAILLLQDHIWPEERLPDIRLVERPFSGAPGDAGGQRFVIEYR